MLVLTQCRHARRLRGLQQICGGRVGHGLKAQDVMGGQAVSPQQNIGLVWRKAQARLLERSTFQTKASTEIMALLNLEWLGGMGVDRSEVEFSGDEEEDGSHCCEACVAAGFAFGRLE